MRHSLQVARTGVRLGLRALRLVNPAREPLVVVAALLTFLEGTGQPGSWWLVAAIGLGNLLVMYLLAWLSKLAGRAGESLLLLFLLRGRSPQGAGAVGQVVPRDTPPASS